MKTAIGILSLIASALSILAFFGLQPRIGKTGKVLVSIVALAFCVFGSFLLINDDSTGPPTLLGGVDTGDYCRSKGYFRSNFPNEVHHVKDWKCVNSDGSATPITNKGELAWDDACRWTYRTHDAYAVNTDPEHAPFSVACYSK
ncbi:hypothetical protein ACF082_01160 [Streptomyces lydicus]|uniref:hypothetical protein n=1 Tax=Streptomyces lydicus TaxID=47763 RepID=UPI0036F7D77D